MIEHSKNNHILVNLIFKKNPNMSCHHFAGLVYRRHRSFTSSVISRKLFDAPSSYLAYWSISDRCPELIRFSDILKIRTCFQEMKINIFSQIFVTLCHICKRQRQNWSSIICFLDDVLLCCLQSLSWLKWHLCGSLMLKELTGRPFYFFATLMDI